MEFRRQVRNKRASKRMTRTNAKLLCPFWRTLNGCAVIYAASTQLASVPLLILASKQSIYLDFILFINSSF